MIRTVEQAWRDICDMLVQAGIEDARFEAAQLVGWASGTDSGTVRTGRKLVTRDQDIALMQAVTRRIDGEPLQYILGQWEFMGLPFTVNPDVLIPRADTEVLAEWLLVQMKRKTAPRVLDLCCGSGCIGISLCCFTPKATAVLADISQKALDVAQKNIELNGISSRAEVQLCDALLPPCSDLGTFDFIACNPPYIPCDDIAGLQKEVLFEPRLALDGGKDGLDFYRAISTNFRSALNIGGILAFECGVGQAGEIADMMRGAGFIDVGILRDLNNIERVIYGTKNN